MSQYWGLWIAIFFLIILPTIAERKQAVTRRHIKKRKKKGLIYMNELVKGYLDKECIIYVAGGSTTTIGGTIRKVEDGWILIEKENKQTELVSLDYISRIQEYPRKKNGKKKLVVTE